MSELQVIESALGRAAARRRWQRALHGLARGALAGGAVLLLAVAVFKLFPINPLVVTWAAIATAALALAGFIAGGWRKGSLLDTARWVDDKQDLKERLSTALELRHDSAPEDWKSLLYADAARHAGGLDARALAPFRLPAPAKWAALVLALCAGLGFAPEYRTPAQKQKQQDAANINDTGKQLSELLRKQLAQQPPALDPVQQAMERAAELGDTLGRQSLTKAEALRDLASAAQKLAEEHRKLDSNPALKPLERAAREPGESGASPEQMRQQLDALAKSMGDAAGKSEKLDKIQEQLRKLQEQAAGLPAKDSPAGAAAREQLAQSLGDLARQAQEAGASLDGLEDAIEALKGGKTDDILRDLEAASHDLEKLRDLAKAMQQLQQQIARLGKDLAEQLDKGQAQAAVASLQKMIEQLKSANLTPEQMQKLTEEVSKAIQPGSEYGKVGEHLKNAAQQCQSGQKSDAAQSLAQAQKELEKLLQEAQDADAVLAALDALGRAQLAVSTGKRWSECQAGNCKACQGAGCRSCRGRIPRWGEGGGLGAGVGTWADESGWTYFPNDEHGGYDNSTVQRPDLDSRGHTDRPEDRSPFLTPDKVKGRMSPGGSMPSITLKGVSIKGTSNVKFEEAAATAQSEAEQALNQDQVPRAYRNAVRDYFDDLKK
jgi:hypothetical protein